MGVQGGAPTPCRNAGCPQGTAKMYHTDPFSIHICHNVSRQAMQVHAPKHHQATQIRNAEDCTLSLNYTPLTHPPSHT